MKSQYTDEFGGYSKTWFADGIQEMRNTDAILDEMEEDGINDCTMAGGDYGMDNLAWSLGLDIEAIALNLALQEDSTPPTQCRPAIAPTFMNQSFNIDSCNSTPNIPLQMNGMRPNLLLKGKGSPVINPIVIRPGT